MFFAISCVTFIVGSALLGVLVFRYNRMAQSELTDRYLQLVRTTGKAIRDYERESTRLMLNSLYLVRELDKKQGTLSNENLRALARETGVTALSVIDTKGDFVRYSKDSPEKIPNFFSFCPLHEQLFTGEATDFATPLIPSSEGIPYKFVSIPNTSGNRVLHAAQQASFLLPLLEQTFFQEKDVLDIAMFSPNGTVLTRYDRQGGGSMQNIDASPYLELDSTVEDLGQELLISHWVRSLHYVCCQCLFSNNTRGKLYDYLLQARVSKTALKQATADLLHVFVLAEIILSLISLFAAKLIARHLSLRLNSIRSQVMNREPNGPPIKIEGADEISELADSFNTLTEKLQKAQQELAETEKERAIAELASQVAHDIRSPLAALNMAARDVEALPEQDRALIRGAVAGIADILNVLDARGERTFGALDSSPLLAPEIRVSAALLAARAASMDLFLSRAKRTASFNEIGPCAPSGKTANRRVIRIFFMGCF